MSHRTWRKIALSLLLIFALASLAQAQQHPGRGRPAPPGQAAPEEAMPPEPPPPMHGMFERMDDMMGPRGMRGHERVMGHEGRALYRMGRLLQRLDLTDDQQKRSRDLLYSHAKKAIGTRAEIMIHRVELRQLLDTEPVDLQKVKELLHTIGAKEADLRFANISLMQDINALLTPEQRQKFRTMRAPFGPGAGPMMGPGGRRLGPEGRYDRERPERRKHWPRYRGMPGRRSMHGPYGGMMPYGGMHNYPYDDTERDEKER